MNTELKEQMLDELARRKLCEVNIETIVEEKEVEVGTGDVQEHEIGVSSTGVKYLKKALANYLNEKGYPLTQENVDMAAKMFEMSENGKMVEKNVKNKITKDIEELSDTELIHYMIYKMLLEIDDLKNQMFEKSFMDYEVIRVEDRGGVTDVESVIRILNEMSCKGWKLKTVFTNELCHNATPVSTSAGNFGFNSTADEVVLIFERSKYINDKIASDLLRKITKK